MITPPQPILYTSPLFLIPVILISVAILGIVVGLTIRAIRLKQLERKFYADRAANGETELSRKLADLGASGNKVLADSEVDKDFQRGLANANGTELATFQVGGPAV